ncbi:hypothetical protein [Helicobacter labetoulli]|uniref:hypothetical protein n=1 Tax=Helicobacter labetoulli TaxID=2315333 RepID=UPI001300B0C5|nr:hypothetical protein [Helicobacter labetoulli]
MQTKSNPSNAKTTIFPRKYFRLGDLSLAERESKYLAWQSAAVNLESRFCNFTNLCRFVKYKF